MTTIRQYLTLASTQLNDQRYNRAFTRWGRDLLLGYMNLGLSELAAYFPKDFTETIQITLKPGRNQSVDIPGGIAGLESNLDGSKIGEMDSELDAAFGQYSTCPADVSFVDGDPKYRVISFAIDKYNNKKFTVDPPVPDGMAPAVNAVIAGQVKPYTLENWDDEINVPQKYINPLMDFILGQALMLNAESALSRQESREHLMRFYSVLGINYKQSSRYKSGYYEGVRGDGDLRVVRP